MAVLAFWVFAPSTLAQPVKADNATSITGVYNGTYAGARGPTKFKLSITHQDNGTLTGECTLYVTEGAGTNEYTCAVRGRYIAATRMVQVTCRTVTQSVLRSPLDFHRRGSSELPRVGIRLADPLNRLLIK
jgi:hypothetical protein